MNCSHSGWAAAYSPPQAEAQPLPDADTTPDHPISVPALCLSLHTELIGLGHNFLTPPLPLPSDWEFLWGWVGRQASLPAGAQHRPLEGVK